ncbi:MAG: DUF4173 domain-containing protein [Planctomycetes bacterium]|nr:DUF4173 domain-containing protein [Planctomycetota bacterium]
MTFDPPALPEEQNPEGEGTGDVLSENKPEPLEAVNKIIPDVPGRKALTALLLVVLFDYFLYRGSGGLGYALLMLITAPLLYHAHTQAPGKFFSLPLGLLLILAIKTLWQCDLFTPWLGFFVLAALALSLTGSLSCIIDASKSIAFSVLRSPIIEAAFLRVFARLRLARKLGAIDGWPILVPLLVIAIFLTVFGLGNPIIASWLSTAGEWFSHHMHNFTDLLPSGWEVAFWIASGLIAAVWLCPFKTEAKQLKDLLGHDEDLPEEYNINEEVERRSLMARNTLIAVNLLFVAYNAVDVNYLWIQQSLPEGISYSEYAITGTVWLTVALALTSFVLGVIFSGDLNFHTRTPRLRFFAWIWAVQNLLLAVFAYHRLSLYVSFNGLTRWRTVGAFGITLVIFGLLIVVRKILNKKSFLWMARRQLVAFALTVFALGIFPIDYIAHTVNTRQILAGEIGPAYQVVNQPKSAEGLSPLILLLDSEDVTVREGVAGVLLKELEILREYDRINTRWTYSELSRRWALQKLTEAEPRLRELIPDGNWQKRIDALEACTSGYEWPGRTVEWRR